MAQPSLNAASREKVLKTLTRKNMTSGMTSRDGREADVVESVLTIGDEDGRQRVVVVGWPQKKDLMTLMACP